MTPGLLLPGLLGIMGVTEAPLNAAAVHALRWIFTLAYVAAEKNCYSKITAQCSEPTNNITTFSLVFPRRNAAGVIFLAGLVCCGLMPA